MVTSDYICSIILILVEKLFRHYVRKFEPLMESALDFLKAYQPVVGLLLCCQEQGTLPNKQCDVECTCIQITHFKEVGRQTGIG